MEVVVTLISERTCLTSTLRPQRLDFGTSHHFTPIRASAFLARVAFKRRDFEAGSGQYKLPASSSLLTIEQTQTQFNQALLYHVHHVCSITSQR